MRSRSAKMQGRNESATSRSAPPVSISGMTPSVKVRSDHRPLEADVVYGLIFWLSRNLLAGSYCSSAPRAVGTSRGRTRFRKARRRQLTEDGNVEITGRDLREREVQGRYPRPHHESRATVTHEAERRFSVPIRSQSRLRLGQSTRSNHRMARC
jgi:hypothetical protein